MRTWRYLIATLGIAGFTGMNTSTAVAQTNVQTTAQTTAIKAARLIDVERGTVLAEPVVLIEGERITGVGRGLAIPAGARVIDLGNATLMPGLIDAHVHLTGDPDDGAYQSLGISVPSEAITGVKNARLTLEAGVTSARNLGASGYSDVALRDAIQRGDVIGPRLVVSGPALGITGGHCDNNLLAPEYQHTGEGVADGPWAARAKVREVVKHGADVIKLCASGGVMSKGTVPGVPQYSLEEMRAIVEEAHRLGKKVAAHAHGAISIREAIQAGVDSVEHVSYIDAEGIRLAKKNGTVLVMDIYNTNYILSEGLKVGMLPESIEKEKQVGKTQRESFRKAFQAGATMAFGTDAGVYPHGDNGKQFASMVEYGMTPMQAIQAATMTSARLLGMEDRVGSIVKGKYADIIAVAGNPLNDIAVMQSVGFVMKGGSVVKNTLAP